MVWSVIIILVVGIIIAVMEAPSLIKQKKQKELYTFSILLLAGISLNIVVSIGIEVPTPLEWIRIIYGY
ncbi:hypothetical protein MK805_05610 [Shimazuella sp. AN120528]|uniref:hypothetical protein n=1 Tax=Shimazuella soli TaxID=1892854 RepID=UPI001F0E56E1|nr:hypothetical protein [Shimazuella soli]MCH5584443.1 hypothetical protein [Shimazuella soli]